MLKITNKFIYITDPDWFENNSLKNPVSILDHKLKDCYPEFYELNYDLKLLVTTAPTDIEKSMPFYNNYKEKFGSFNIETLKMAAVTNPAKNVLLNGFNQKHFEYIAPFIKDTIEVLYLFKCPKINDLSILSEFSNLKCLLIFWNNALESLWNFDSNARLKILSFVSVTKLRNLDTLADSKIEYITFDSSDNNGNKKDILFDEFLFNNVPNLKHLSLNYKNCKIDY